MINPSVAGFILCQLELDFPEFPSLYGFRLGLTTKKKKKKKVQFGGVQVKKQPFYCSYWLQVVKDREVGENSGWSLYPHSTSSSPSQTVPSLSPDVSLKIQR